MSWVSKTLKKAGNSIKKHYGNKISAFADPLMVGRGLYESGKGMAEAGKKTYDEYKRNEGAYNRALATVAASIVTGGLGGAALGAAGVSGASFASGAVSGGIAGAVSGTRNAAQETMMASAERAKQREEEAAQRRINAINAAASPTNQSQYNYEGVTPGMRSALYANYKTKQKGGTSKSTLGGSNNTMLG